MKRLIVILIMILVMLLSTRFIYSQVTQEWVQRYNGTGNGWDEKPYSAIDPYGNLYVSGSSRGIGTHDDYLTIKYNSNGDSLWVQRYNGPRNLRDFVFSIAVDPSGNVYVAGKSLGNGFYYDFATIKYNSSGVQQWIQRYDALNPEYYNVTMAVDASGNVYVAGTSQSNYVTIKYNSIGIQQWVQIYNSPGSWTDNVNCVAIDTSGNVYVTGQSAYNIATIKYSASGVQQWVQRYASIPNGFDEATSLSVDGLGNVYVAGYCSGITTPDYLTIKYNSNGDSLWVQKYNGPANLGDVVNSMQVDDSGNVYVTGESHGVTSVNNSDYVTIKYNTSGVQQWIQRYNGTNSSYIERATSLAVDNLKNIYVAGFSEEDYATIKYNTFGIQQWVQKYNGTGNYFDNATAVVIDKSGENVYVTGHSIGNGTAYDFATIKYTQPLPQLSGTYTIGSGGDYVTITSAVEALVSNGVSGPVVLNIKSGTYDEVVILDSIPGVSSINTVLFQSETGNANDVTWTSTNPSIEFVLKINNADFLTFKNLTFSDSVPAFFETRIKLYINGNVDQLKIVRNNFTSRGGIKGHGIYSSNAVTHGLWIEQNSINSNYGIVFTASLLKSYNTKIINNFFSGSINLIISNHDFLIIEKNELYARGGYLSGISCITLTSCNGVLNILKNKMYASSYDRHLPAGGLTLDNCFCTNSMIANNFITFAFSNGLRISNSSGINAYHNSLYTYSLSSETVNISSSTLINSKNNIIVSLSWNGFMYPSYSYAMLNSAVTSNYNNFHHGQPYLGVCNGTQVTNIHHLRSITGNDSNSNEVSVSFVGPPDLHLSGFSLNNDSLKGIYIPEVSDDIDGNPRDTSNPTMGADEPSDINLKINLIMFIEGFFNPEMNIQVGDIIKTYLRSASSPYNIVDSSVVYLNSIGTTTLKFFNAPTGTYYLVIKHRNGMETWSKSGGESLNIGGTISYDFSNMITQAYGNNIILKGSKYCIYSGDVNKDAIIDASDLSLVDNAAFNSISGYVAEDVTGDNFVDAADLSIVDNNAFSGVTTLRP